MVPSDSQFKEAFGDLHVTKAILARYYLRSLEETARAVPEPWFVPESDPLVISLEHVLPGKPEGNWPSFTDEEVAQYANRLGNLALMLTKDNSEIKSAPFAEKCEIYKRAPFTLTNNIAEHTTWTVDDIIERQALLAELAVKTWPVA